MSAFACLLLCIQACLIQNVFGVCSGAAYGPYASIDASLAAPMTTPYSMAAPFTAPCGAGLTEYGYKSCSDYGYKGYSDYGYKGYSDYGYKGFSDIGCGAKYGGSGIGNVAVAGELPVGGSTALAGQVPIIGAVEYAGPVAAAGTVTISGNCACGSASASYGYNYC